MHILHISLNRHYVGGGLVNHVDKLMLKQAAKGYKVSYFSSGKDFFLGLPSIKKVSIKKLSGITIYELRNSPNKPLKQRGRPLNEIYDPLIESCFKKVLDEAKPDIVHIHDLQGLCASLIDISVDEGYPTIFTFHNYWPLCPEVELFDFEDRNCENYEEGTRCVPCNYSPPSFYLKLKLASKLGFITNSIIYRNLKNTLKLGKKSSMKIYPHKNKIAEFYVKRRKRIIESINRCHALFGISNRVNEIFIEHGTDKEKLKVVNNSLFVDDETLKSIENVRKARSYEFRDKINFCFRGRMVTGKGIYTCIEAFKRISGKKAGLHLYGYAGKEFLAWLKSQQINNIVYRGRYTVEELPEMLANIDVGIVPTLWEECFGTVGLEFLAAGIPVIASRIGGLSDFIEDGKSGIFFEPGNTEKLADIMESFVNNPERIKDLSLKIPEKLKTLDDLFIEMDGIYKSIL